MVELPAMRDLRELGRYFLYGALLLVLFIGLQHNQFLMGVALFALILGVPGYWFWTLAVHRRDHLDDPDQTCKHCRVRAEMLRKEERREAEQEDMDRLSRKYDA